MTQVTPLLTTAQVAHRFRVHPATVRRWVDDNLLTAVRLPSGQHRFRPEDIDAICAERAESA